MRIPTKMYTHSHTHSSFYIIALLSLYTFLGLSFPRYLFLFFYWPLHRTRLSTAMLLILLRVIRLGMYYYRIVYNSYVQYTFTNDCSTSVWIIDVSSLSSVRAIVYSVVENSIPFYIQFIFYNATETDSHSDGGGGGGGRGEGIKIKNHVSEQRVRATIARLLHYCYCATVVVKLKSKT